MGSPSNVGNEGQPASPDILLTSRCGWVTADSTPQVPQPTTQERNAVGQPAGHHRVDLGCHPTGGQRGGQADSVRAARVDVGLERHPGSRQRREQRQAVGHRDNLVLAGVEQERGGGVRVDGRDRIRELLVGRHADPAADGGVAEHQRCRTEIGQRSQAGGQVPTRGESNHRDALGVDVQFPGLLDQPTQRGHRVRKGVLPGHIHAGGVAQHERVEALGQIGERDRLSLPVAAVLVRPAGQHQHCRAGFARKAWPRCDRPDSRSARRRARPGGLRPASVQRRDVTGTASMSSNDWFSPAIAQTNE